MNDLRLLHLDIAVRFALFFVSGITNSHRYLNKDLQEYYDVDVYRESLNMILDYDDQDGGAETDRGMVEQGAQCLYGLIHAR